MKRFCVSWDEEVEFLASVIIEAETKEEALKKWEEGDFEDYERDERSNSFDEDSVEVEEIED